MKKLVLIIAIATVGVIGCHRSKCPPSSACGCSEHKKADCGGPCCKWTVGKGCGCSDSARIE